MDVEAVWVFRLPAGVDVAHTGSAVEDLPFDLSVLGCCKSGCWVSNLIFRDAQIDVSQDSIVHDVDGIDVTASNLATVEGDLIVVERIFDVGALDNEDYSESRPHSLRFCARQRFCARPHRRQRLTFVPPVVAAWAPNRRQSRLFVVIHCHRDCIIRSTGCNVVAQEIIRERRFLHCKPPSPQ